MLEFQRKTKFAALLGALWLTAALGCNASSPVSRELGASCQTHDDCGEICLSGDDFPDGFCSQSCDDTGDCAGNAVCVDIDQGICLLPCTTTEDCGFLGPGWTCTDKDPRPATSDEVRVCAGN